MPFVTVTAAPPPDDAALAARSVGSAVAAALALPADAVLTALVRAEGGVDGAGAASPFVVVDIRGRARPVELREAATAAARIAVVDHWLCRNDMVWVQWHLP